MDIIKASGERQPFNHDKFCASLKKAGAPAGVVSKICVLVEEDLKPNTSTEQIAKKAQTYLQEESMLFGARYQLKKGIMELGPSGFFFEEYAASVLNEYGYKTQVGRKIRGKCLSHEIDIFAEKENEHYIIELKYRNKRGSKIDVQVAMYTYARFLDIQAAHREFEEKSHQAWVITNTKFTRNAIAYAKCMGMTMTGWRYPGKENLEELITKKSLYPVTVLPSANKSVRQRLAAQRLMFVRDILAFSPNDLQKKFSFNSALAKRLLQEAYNLV
jgi:Holliday junction resolvase-like predicted endonuclease